MGTDRNPARWAGLREPWPSARRSAMASVGSLQPWYPVGGTCWLEARTGRPPSAQGIALGRKLPGGRALSIPWQCFNCQRAAAASAGGSWSEHLEASWYTDGSAGALRRSPPRAGGAVSAASDLAPLAFRRGSAAPDLASPPRGANGSPREADDASREARG